MLLAGFGSRVSEATAPSAMTVPALISFNLTVNVVDRPGSSWRSTRSTSLFRGRTAAALQ